MIDLNKRLEELQAAATIRGKGTQWSLSDTGTFEVTNVSPSPSVNIEPQKEEDNFLQRMREEMAKIDEMPAEDRLGAIAQLNGSANSFLASRRQALIQLSEQEFQVASLQKTLEENIQMDRNTPEYFAKYGTADSDETAAVRQQLQVALANSRASAQQRMMSDPAIAQVEGELTPFLSAQSQFVANAGRSKRQIREYGEGVRRVADILNPGASDDLVIKNVGKYSELATAMQTPEILLQEALAGKSPEALILFPHSEAEAVSGTSDKNNPKYKEALQQGKDDINLVKALMTRPELLQEAVKNSSLSKDRKDALKDLESKAKLDRGFAQQFEAEKQNFAIAYVEQKRADVFKNEVETWSNTNAEGLPTTPFTENTPLGEAYSNVKKKLGKDVPVSISLLVSEIRQLPPEKRAMADIALKEAFTNARGNAARGMFGAGIGRLNADIDINTEIARSVLNTDLAAIEGLLGSPGGGTPGLAMSIGGNLIKAQLDELLGELPEGEKRQSWQISQ